MRERERGSGEWRGVVFGAKTELYCGSPPSPSPTSSSLSSPPLHPELLPVSPRGLLPVGDSLLCQTLPVLGEGRREEGRKGGLEEGRKEG